MGALGGAYGYTDRETQRRTAKEVAESALRTELWKAKVALCEARHQAREAGHELADRVDEMFNDADRLFCDARSEEQKRLADIGRLLDVEYGPATQGHGLDLDLYRRVMLECGGIVPR